MTVKEWYETNNIDESYDWWFKNNPLVQMTFGTSADTTHAELLAFVKLVSNGVIKPLGTCEMLFESDVSQVPRGLITPFETNLTNANNSACVKLVSNGVIKPLGTCEMLFESDVSLAIFEQIFNSLLLDIVPIFKNYFEIMNAKSSFSTSGTTGIGYSGYDLENQAGQFQKNTNESSNYDFHRFYDDRIKLVGYTNPIDKFRDNFIDQLVVQFNWLGV